MCHLLWHKMLGCVLPATVPPVFSWVSTKGTDLGTCIRATELVIPSTSMCGSRLFPRDRSAGVFIIPFWLMDQTWKSVVTGQWLQKAFQQSGFKGISKKYVSPQKMLVMTLEPAACEQHSAWSPPRPQAAQGPRSAPGSLRFCQLHCIRHLRSVQPRRRTLLRGYGN